jgi:hypothetical protein
MAVGWQFGGSPKGWPPESEPSRLLARAELKRALDLDRVHRSKEACRAAAERKAALRRKFYPVAPLDLARAALLRTLSNRVVEQALPELLAICLADGVVRAARKRKPRVPRGPLA